MSVARTSGATQAKIAATMAGGRAYRDRVASNRPARASAAAEAMSGSSAVTTTCGKVSHVDLRLLPQQQLKGNPALDLEEVQVCPLCGNPLTGRVCLNCFGAGKAGAAEQYSDTEPLE